MKATAKQVTMAYVHDSKSFIDGNVAEHLILNVRSEDQGYQDYLTDDEIEYYEKASSKKRAEIRTHIETWIKDNFDFDINDFEY